MNVMAIPRMIRQVLRPVANPVQVEVQKLNATARRLEQAAAAQAPAVPPSGFSANPTRTAARSGARRCPDGGHYWQGICVVEGGTLQQCSRCGVRAQFDLTGKPLPEFAGIVGDGIPPMKCARCGHRGIQPKHGGGFICSHCALEWGETKPDLGVPSRGELNGHPGTLLRKYGVLV